MSQPFSSLSRGLGSVRVIFGEPGNQENIKEHPVSVERCVLQSIGMTSGSNPAKIAHEGFIWVAVLIPGMGDMGEFAKSNPIRQIPGIAIRRFEGTKQQEPNSIIG